MKVWFFFSHLSLFRAHFSCLSHSLRLHLHLFVILRSISLLKFNLPGNFCWYSVLYVPEWIILSQSSTNIPIFVQDIRCFGKKIDSMPSGVSLFLLNIFFYFSFFQWNFSSLEVYPDKVDHFYLENYKKKNEKKKLRKKGLHFSCCVWSMRDVTVSAQRYSRVSWRQMSFTLKSDWDCKSHFQKVYIFAIFDSSAPFCAMCNAWKRNKAPFRRWKSILEGAMEIATFRVFFSFSFVYQAIWLCCEYVCSFARFFTCMAAHKIS